MNFIKIKNNRKLLILFLNLLINNIFCLDKLVCLNEQEKAIFNYEINKIHVATIEICMKLNTSYSDLLIKMKEKNIRIKFEYFLSPNINDNFQDFNINNFRISSFLKKEEIEAFYESLSQEDKKELENYIINLRLLAISTQRKISSFFTDNSIFNKKIENYCKSKNKNLLLFIEFVNYNVNISFDIN